MTTDEDCKRLFREGVSSMELKLVESKSLPNGVMTLVYRPAGN